MIIQIAMITATLIWQQQQDCDNSNKYYYSKINAIIISKFTIATQYYDNSNTHFMIKAILLSQQHSVMVTAT